MIRNVRHDNQRPERPRNIWKPKVQQKQEASYAQVVSGVSVSGQKHQKYGSEGPQESVRGVVNEVVGGLAENEATFNGEEALGLEAWPMVERGLLRISVGNEEACVTMNEGASHEEEHVVNVVGPLENIHPGINGEAAENEAVFNGEEALGLEAWPMVERGLLRIKVSNEEACVTMNEGVSHEEEHVVNVVAPLENIHPGINGGAAENEAALNVEVAHVVEVVENELMGVKAANEGVTNSLNGVHVESKKLVGSKVGINEQGHIRNVVVVGDEKEGESGSMMACGLLPLNVECSTHIPSIKVGHAKSLPGLNKAISNTWLEEFEESLGGVGALDHEESVGWVGDSVRLGPRLGELEQSGVREVGMGDVASIDHGISGEILGHVVVADGGNARGLVGGRKKGFEGVMLVMEGKGLDNPSRSFGGTEANNSLLLVPERGRI
ncbi:hypothetical protein ACSQ67_016554 [Phaseolus vulgaris]